MSPGVLRRQLVPAAGRQIGKISSRTVWPRGTVHDLLGSFPKELPRLTAVGEEGRDGPARERGSARAALGLLGISARAGALVSGTQAVRAAVRAGGIHYVVLALDAAAGQRSKLVPLLEARRIPYHIAFSQDELGAALGRPPISAVGFSNPDLAGRVGQLIGELARQGHQQGGS